jgi:hypothetical protein
MGDFRPQPEGLGAASGIGRRKSLQASPSVERGIVKLLSSDSRRLDHSA